jgi:hypothetical protein
MENRRLPVLHPRAASYFCRARFPSPRDTAAPHRIVVPRGKRAFPQSGLRALFIQRRPDASLFVIDALNKPSSQNGAFDFQCRQGG